MRKLLRVAVALGGVKERKVKVKTTLGEVMGWGARECNRGARGDTIAGGGGESERKVKEKVYYHFSRSFPAKTK